MNTRQNPTHWLGLALKRCPTWGLLSLAWACLSARAEYVTLVLESYPPAALPRVSKIIEVSSTTNQLEIAEQAALFAFSEDGWGLGGYGDSVYLAEPPAWSGSEYLGYIPGPSPTLSALFGYELNSEALQFGSKYALWFHTDEWTTRLSHQTGETVNNYGVISGNMGGVWFQCAVTNWGSFSTLPPYFTYNPIQSPQVMDVPFPLTITAGSISGTKDTSFTNTVTLSGYACIPVPTNCFIGTGSNTWAYPLNTYYHDARTQVIYLTNEIGLACTINSLALDITTPPGQSLENWTIRMKHTELAAYSASPSWESNDWTVVYQASEPAGTTGWRTFQFTTPFDYNGTNNLLIDFSFNNASFSTAGQCQSTVAGTYRSLTLPRTAKMAIRSLGRGRLPLRRAVRTCPTSGWLALTLICCPSPSRPRSPLRS